MKLGPITFTYVTAFTFDYGAQNPAPYARFIYDQIQSVAIRVSSLPFYTAERSWALPRVAAPKTSAAITENKIGNLFFAFDMSSSSAISLHYKRHGSENIEPLQYGLETLLYRGRQTLAQRTKSGMSRSTWTDKAHGYFSDPKAKSEL